MRMMPIASGSSGNCIYLGTEDTHVLFDAGVSRKRIEEGLNTAGLSLKDIDKILNKNNIKDLIIEYNRTLTDKNKTWDERIVIRDNEISKTNKGEQNLCIVLSLSKNEVITAYYNPLYDNHATINMDRYDKFPINGI